MDATYTEVLFCSTVNGLLLWYVSGIEVVGHDEQLEPEIYALVVHYNFDKRVNIRKLINVPQNLEICNTPQRSVHVLQPIMT